MLKCCRRKKKQNILIEPLIKDKDEAYDEEYINPFRQKVRFDLTKNETRTYLLSPAEKYDKKSHWNNIRRKYNK